MTAQAFVPAHVTAFFSVERRETPAASGARGGGIALADGVEVTVEDGTGVVLEGEETELEAVTRVLSALDVTAAVRIETDLPLASGFGLSGAAALGTALAANRAFELGRTENELVTVAHVADLQAGTGLGDVVAQAHGGVPVRLAPGAPDHNRLDAIPAVGQVEVLPLGTVATEGVLADDTDPLSAAGQAALEQLMQRPTLPHLMRVGRAFAEETDLLVGDLRAVIDAVEAAGGLACVGLLGRTVVALDDGLSAAGYDPRVTRIDPGGARLLDRP